MGVYTRILQNQPAGDTLPGGETLNRQLAPFASGGLKPCPPVPPLTADAAVGCTIDGNGSNIEIDAQGTTYVKDAQTIVRATLVFLPGITGSIVVDVWVVPFFSYSIANPAYSICAAAKPTISAAQDSQDSVLIGWSAVIPANSWVIFTVDSSVTPDVKWAHLVLDTVLS